MGFVSCFLGDMNLCATRRAKTYIREVAGVCILTNPISPSPRIIRAMSRFLIPFCAFILGLVAVFGNPVAKAACCEAAERVAAVCPCCAAKKAKPSCCGHQGSCPCQIKATQPPKDLFFAEAEAWGIPPVPASVWSVCWVLPQTGMPLTRGEQWALPPPDTLVQWHVLMLI